jgi:SAM-dependent methyltransferase
MEEHKSFRPDDAEYQRLARGEIEHYSQIFLAGKAAPSARETLMQPVPATWIEVERRASELVREQTGFDLSGHVLNELRKRPNAEMLSLGSGPGGVELSFAREAPDAGITCYDLNPDLVSLGRERAMSEGLRARFEVADLNFIELGENTADVVFCHAALHHVVELERLAAQIKRALRPGGSLITIDVCTRNGYLMWPETRQRVQDLFRTLPPRLRINHTAYAEPALDEAIWEADTSAGSMECVRSQDIIPVLSSTFRTVHNVPYFSICRRLVDTMYGPNYDLSRPLDSAALNWIWQLDRFYIETRILKPETFFAIYQK